MAFDQELAQRIRLALGAQKKMEEKQMMGGLTFMVNGKMCVGIIKDELMVRIDPDAQQMALEETGCRPMDFTGRPMKGFVMVDRLGMGTQTTLQKWVNLALDWNERAKPAKKKKK